MYEARLAIDCALYNIVCIYVCVTGVYWDEIIHLLWGFVCERFSISFIFFPLFCEKIFILPTRLMHFRMHSDLFI